MTSTPDPSPVPVARPPAGLFWCGVCLITGWIALIGWLALTSANPITLNRRQIFESDVVLVGQVTGNQGGTLVEPVPEEPWPLPDKTPIKIRNLADTRAAAGHRYLFPLKRISSRKSDGEGEAFEVTPSALPNAEPLVYPAGPEAMSQLKQILQEPPPPISRRKAVPPPRSPAARD